MECHPHTRRMFISQNNVWNTNQTAKFQTLPTTAAMIELGAVVQPCAGWLSIQSHQPLEYWDAPWEGKLTATPIARYPPVYSSIAHGNFNERPSAIIAKSKVVAQTLFFCLIQVVKCHCRIDVCEAAFVEGTVCMCFRTRTVGAHLKP